MGSTMQFDVNQVPRKVGGQLEGDAAGHGATDLSIAIKRPGAS